MSNSTQFKNSTIGVGDKVKVVQRILESGKERRQIFIGTIIKIGGDKDNKSMTVRKIGVNQIGIEKIYLLNNPSIEEIAVTKPGLSGSRRSKLYYVRSQSKKEIDKIYSRTTRKTKK